VADRKASKAAYLECLFYSKMLKFRRIPFQDIVDLSDLVKIELFQKAINNG
jgi:hypothetical protein